MRPKIKKFLKTLKKTKNEFWNIDEKVGQFLNCIVKIKKYKTVLEIGTSNGYSGIWLAEALKTTRGRLYTIESHRNRFALATQNFKKSNLQNYITQIQGHAPKDLPKIPKFFDLAFFDATKQEHISYFQALFPKIKPGGLIITDNIHSHKKELAPYIKKIKTFKNWRSIELTLGDGLLLSLKLSPDD